MLSGTGSAGGILRQYSNERGYADREGMLPDEDVDQQAKDNDSGQCGDGADRLVAQVLGTVLLSGGMRSAGNVAGLAETLR